MHPLHHPSAYAATRIWVSGKGAIITDSNGREYIDGLSGLWNVNIGHGRTELGAAAKAQMDTLAFHSAYAGGTNEKAIALAAKMSEVAPYEDNGTWRDVNGLDCPELADPPWDDDFADVTVPILYMGAHGGWGAQGYATAELFTSAEVTLAPPVDPPTDACPWQDLRACAFGHEDLLYADNAPEEAWDAILAWLEDH